MYIYIYICTYTHTYPYITHIISVKFCMSTRSDTSAALQALKGRSLVVYPSPELDLLHSAKRRSWEISVSKMGHMELEREMYVSW